LEEDGRVIDERAQDAEGLRGRERAAPGVEPAGEAIVVGAVGSLIGGRQIGALAELIPLHARALGEAARAPPLLAHGVDLDRALGGHPDPEGDALLDALALGLVLDLPEALVERPQREPPGG